MIKTVTLQTAKALKEAGFKVNTYFNWARRKDIINGGHYEHDIFVVMEEGLKDIIPAPTSDELLEELPEFILHRFKKSFFIRYLYGRNLLNEVTFENESLCECLAQMYLYLASNKLLEGKCI